MPTEPTHEFWGCELQGDTWTLVFVTFKDSEIDYMDAMYNGCLSSLCLPGNAMLLLGWNTPNGRVPRFPHYYVDWEWAQWMVAEWKKRCAARDAPPGAPDEVYATV